MKGEMRELDPLTFLVAESLLGNPRLGSRQANNQVGATISDGPGRARESVCLVLLAHGSKDPRWRAPFERLASELQQDLGTRAVRLAYMEFTGPTLMDVAQECAGQMNLNLRLLPLPLFMAVGAHLAKDIPEQVAEIRGQFPQLPVEVLPPIGEDARLVALVENIAREAARR